MSPWMRHFSQGEIQSMISDVNDDGSGVIVHEEFLKAITHKIMNRNPKDQILKTFRLLDDDETRKITSNELKNDMHAFGLDR